MQVKQAVAHFSSQLAAAGVDHPGLEIRLLLAQALNCATAFLLAYPEYVIPPSLLKSLQLSVERRCRREPLAYILENKEFWGLPFKVSPATLIPRPDSETLIAAALSYAKTLPASIHILDLGTGSGCLLLALLSELPKAFGIGTDQSAEAIKIARENAHHLGLTERVKFVQDNWASSLGGTYPLIISNPPYIKHSDIKGLMPEIRQFEPHAALDGGMDGLECYRQIFPEAARLLSDNGRLLMEIGDNQQQDLVAMANGFHFSLCGAYPDLTQKIRCLEWKKG
ncbi:MAG: peptide chain release factor N(5)-glutamine methyltransferase [Rhodospirillaceae bacterium]|nr:peptide chain release factor N(5)-glutamine methyltransferase [Rhodospirillaceae bacterium]